jgi:hypothetical protein
MKIWDVVPCGLVNTDVSEVLAASVVRAVMTMMETTPLKCWSAFARLHGATSQKTVILVLI